MALTLDEPGYLPGPISARAGERVRPVSRWTWVFVGCVVFGAFLLRAAYVVATRHSYRPVTDSSNFDLIASSLVHGHGFGPALVPPAAGPTAYRGPLYPVALAGVYAVFGHSWTAGRLEEAVFGTAVVVLIGVVAAQLFGRRVAAVALVIAAVHPTLVLYGTSLQLEPLLVALSLAALAAALQHRRAPRGLLWPIACGALIGLALDTRELGIVLVVPCLLLCAAPGRGGHRRGYPSTLAAALAVLITAAIVMVPWTVRNAVRFHAFVPTSTSTGFTVSGTYNDSARLDRAFPTIWRPPYNDPALTKLLLSKTHPSEVWVNQQLVKATVDYVRAHPAYPLRAMFWNTVGLFDLEGPRVALFVAPYIPFSARLVRLAVYSSYVLEVLALVALMLRRTRQAPGAVWLIPASAVVLLALVSGNIRYRASIEPFTVILASVAVTAALERGRGIRARDRTALVTAGGSP